MQELLGRITQLDPQASQALRVIACFDELSIGGVNIRGLLACAASLAGCVAGFRQDDPVRTMRVTPRGEMASCPPGPMTTADASSGLTVWLEREGEPAANDAIILERLALAVRIRHGRGRSEIDGRRRLGALVDPEVPCEERIVTAASFALSTATRYRAVAAPLFAVWTKHPTAPEDVVPTRYGPIHLIVVPVAITDIVANPCGIGVACTLDQLDHSFRTALVALRLCDPPRTQTVNADEYAGLVDLLADAAADSHNPDIELVDAVAIHPWGIATLDAVIRSASARQAARLASVHHSTMQTRIETVIAELGFDPYEGYGRVRAGIAYLTWRLRRSRVLELPAPSPAARQIS